MILSGSSKNEIEAWQEQWIQSGTTGNSAPYTNPIEQAKKLINEK